jgi:hypothetical protein
MRRKLFAVLTAVVLLSVTVSPAFAQSIRITLTGFRLASLIADGKVRLLHTHPEDTHVALEATGFADVTCEDGHTTWVVEHVRVAASGSTTVWAGQFNHRGVASFSVETGDPYPLHDPCEGHTVQAVGFVFWDASTVSAETAETGLFTQQFFRCETTYECVTCTRVRRH